jgi:hypothetical protein
VQKIFQLALPPCFLHNKKAATLKIADMFLNQVKQNGSDVRIKMYICPLLLSRGGLDYLDIE